MRSAALLICLVFALVACSSKKDDRPQPTSAPGATETADKPAQAPAEEPRWYRARLSLSPDRIDIPFFLRLPSPGIPGTAVVEAGAERAEVEVRWRDAKTASLPFAIFNSELVVTVADNTLSGEWSLDSKAWGSHRLALSGERIVGPDDAVLFVEAATEPARDVAGVWKLSFEESGIAKLVLESRDKHATGLLTFSTGNRIALRGEASGSMLRLAGFNGATPYLLIADIEGAELTGEWKAGPGLGWREGFDGARSEDFSVATDPTLESKRVAVKGVDLSAYQGKPHIIELAGSWCITCKYAAPFLVEVYEEFHPRGLEMITLAYEFTDDESYNRTQADLFRTTYAIPWQVVPVHGSADKAAEILPTGLGDFDISGFPISIFVDKSGAVTHLHAGFTPDPETPEYRKLSEEYRARVADLLVGAALPRSQKK